MILRGVSTFPSVATYIHSQKMAPTLHQLPASPPVRAVLITAKALNLELNLKEINILTGENRSAEYLKLNPQHTVPTLVDDDGFVLWDSHAILPYLVSKYGKTDALYPKDVKKRAIVDQRLHFESGVLFSRIIRITKPIIYHNIKTINEEDKNNIIEAYDFLEKFLEGSEWMAGDFISVADFSIMPSVTYINNLIPLDIKKHANVISWLERIKKRPELEANLKGEKDLEQLLKSKLSVG